MTEKVEKITDFIGEGIYNGDLPFDWIPEKSIPEELREPPALLGRRDDMGELEPIIGAQ